MNYKQGKINQQPVLEITGKQHLEVHGSATVMKSPLSFKQIASHNRPVSKINLSIPSPQPSEAFRNVQFNADIRMHYATTYNQQPTDFIKKPNLNKFSNADYSLIYPRKSQIIESQDENNQKISKKSQQKEGLEIKLFDNQMNEIQAQDSERIVLSLNAQDMLDLNQPNQYSKSKNSIILIGSSQYERRRSQIETINDKKSIYQINQDKFKNSKYHLHQKQERDYDQNTLSALNQYDSANRVIQKIDSKIKKNWRKSGMYERQQKDGGDNIASNKSSINISMNEVNHLNQAMMLEANSKRDLLQTGTSQDLYNTQYFMSENLLKLASKSLRQKEKRIEKNIAVVNLQYDQIQKVINLSSSPQTRGHFKNQFFQKNKNLQITNRLNNSLDPKDIIQGKKIKQKYMQIDNTRQDKQFYLVKQKSTYQSPSGITSVMQQNSQNELDLQNKKSFRNKNNSGYVNFQMNSQQNGGDIYRSVIKTKTFHMDSGKFSPIVSDESVESLVQRQNSGLSKKRSNLNIQNSLSNSKQSKKQMKKYYKIQNSQQKLSSQVNLEQVQNLDDSLYIKKIEQNDEIYKVKIQNIDVQNDKRYKQENRVETSQDLSIQKQQEVIHSVQIPQVDKLQEKNEFKFGLEEIAQNTEQPKSRNSSLALSRKTSSQNSQKQINQLKDSENILQQSKSLDNQYSKDDDVLLQQKQIAVAAMNQLHQDQIRRQQMQQFLSENEQLQNISKNPFDLTKINQFQKMNQEGIQPIVFDHNEAFMSTIKFLEDSFQVQPSDDLQKNETLMKNYMNQQNYQMLLAAQNSTPQQIIQSFGGSDKNQLSMNSPLGQLIDTAILNLDLNITSNRFHQKNQKSLQNKKSNKNLKSLNQSQIKDIQITRRNSSLEPPSPATQKQDSPVQNQKDVVIERKPLQIKEFEFFKNKKNKKLKNDIQKQNEVDLVQTGMDADSYQNMYSQIYPHKNQSQSFLFQPQVKKEQELAYKKTQNQQNIIMIGGNSVQQLIGFSQIKNHQIQETKNQNSDTFQSQNLLEIQNEIKNQEVDLNDMTLKQVHKDSAQGVKLTEELENFLQKAQINESVTAEQTDIQVIKEDIQQDSMPAQNEEIPIQMALNKFDMTRNIFLDSLMKNLDFINQLKNYNEKEIILNKESLINKALPFRMCHYKFDDKNKNYKKHLKIQSQSLQKTIEIDKNFLNQSSESSFPLINNNSQKVKFSNKKRFDLSLGSIQQEPEEKSLIEGVAIVNNKGVNMYSNRDFKTLPSIQQNNQIDKKQMMINFEKEDFLMSLRKYNQTISPQINELLPFNCSIKGEVAVQSKYQDLQNQKPKKQVISRNVRIKTNFSTKNSSLNGMKMQLRTSEEIKDSTATFEEQNDFIEHQQQQQELIRKPDKFIHNVSLFQPSYLIRDKFKKLKDPLQKLMTKKHTQTIEQISPQYITDKLRQKSMIHQNEQFQSQQMNQFASQHPFNSLQSKRKGGLQQLFMQSLMFPSAFDIYKQSILLKQDSNRLDKDHSSKNHLKMTESFLDKLQKGDSSILNDNNGSPLTEVLGQSVFDVNDSTPQPAIQKSESLKALKTKKDFKQHSSSLAYHQIFEQNDQLNQINGHLNQELIQKQISGFEPFNEDAILNSNLKNQIQNSGNKKQNYHSKDQQSNILNEQSIISNFKSNFKKENMRYKENKTEEQQSNIQNQQIQNTISQKMHTSTQAQFSQHGKYKPSVDIENKLHILQDTILDTLEKTEQNHERQLRRQEHRRIKMISLKSFGSNEIQKIKINQNNKQKDKLERNYESDGSAYSSPDRYNHIKTDSSIIKKTQIFQRTFENSVKPKNLNQYDLKTIQDEDATMMRVKIIDMKKKDLKLLNENKFDKDKQLVQILIRRTAEGQDRKEFELQQKSPNDQAQIQNESGERTKNITTRQLAQRDNTGTLESPSIEIIKSSVQQSPKDLILNINDVKRDYIYVQKDSISQKSKRRVIQDVKKLRQDGSDQDKRIESQNNINEIFKANLSKSNDSKQILKKPIVSTQRSQNRQSEQNDEMSQTYQKSSLNEYEKISQSQKLKVSQKKKNRKKQNKKQPAEDLQVDEEKFRKSIKLQNSFVSKKSKNLKQIQKIDNEDVQSRSFQISDDEASHFSNNSNHGFINSNYSKSMVGQQKEEFLNSKLSIYKNNMTSKEAIEKGDKKRVKVFEDNMKKDDSKEALRVIKKNKIKSKKREDSVKSPSKLHNYNGSHQSVRQSKKTLMRQESLRSSVSGYGDSPLNNSQQKIRKIVDSRIRMMNHTNTLFQSNQNNYYSQVRQMNYTQGQIDQKNIYNSNIKPLQEDMQVKIVSKKYEIMQKNNSPLQNHNKNKLTLNGKLIIDGNNNGQLDRLLQNMLSQSNSKYSNPFGQIERKGKKNIIQGRLAKQGPLANRGGQVDLNKSDEMISFNIQAQFIQSLEKDLDSGRLNKKELIITKGMKLYENNQLIL